MNRDFNLGRLYERREVCAFMVQLLSETDPERRELLVKQWLAEAAETLNLPQRRVLIVEETVVVL